MKNPLLEKLLAPEQDNQDQTGYRSTSSTMGCTATKLDQNAKESQRSNRSFSVDGMTREQKLRLLAKDIKARQDSLQRENRNRQDPPQKQNNPACAGSFG